MHGPMGRQLLSPADTPPTAPQLPYWTTRAPELNLSHLRSKLNDAPDYHKYEMAAMSFKGRADLYAESQYELGRARDLKSHAARLAHAAGVQFEVSEACNKRAWAMISAKESIELLTVEKLVKAEKESQEAMRAKEEEHQDRLAAYASRAQSSGVHTPKQLSEPPQAQEALRAQSLSEPPQAQEALMAQSSGVYTPKQPSEPPPTHLRRIFD